MSNTKDLMELLEKIRNTNDFEILKSNCLKLSNLIKNSDYKNKYQENINRFLEYYITDEYKKDYEYLVNKLNEIYDIENVYYDSLFPIFNDIITNIKDINSGDGLINAYLFCTEDNMSYEKIFNDNFYLVDYALFEIMTNDNFYPAYDKYLYNLGEILLNEYLNEKPNSFGIVSTITTKILKDYLKFIQKANVYNSDKKILKTLNLKEDEIKIIKLYNNWNYSNGEPTQENIGQILNPQLTKNNVSQKVMFIKQKLLVKDLTEAKIKLENEYGVNLDNL